MEVDGWAEYRRYLIATLERLEASVTTLNQRLDDFRHDGNAEVSRLREEMNALRIEFGMQKVRTSLLGAAAGSVPPVVVAIIWYLTR